MQNDYGNFSQELHERRFSALMLAGLVVNFFVHPIQISALVVEIVANKLGLKKSGKQLIQFAQHHRR